MKTILSIAIITIIIFTLSCRPTNRIIGKLTGEFKEPQQESAESIISFCQNKKVKYDKLYVIKSESNFSTFFKKHKYVPGIFVFDNSNNLIARAEKTGCPWAMINFLYDTAVQKEMTQDTTIYLDIISNFKLVNDRTGDKKADYYILCTWAKFVPKLSDALFETINRQKEDNKLKVSHILLNVDLQKEWETNN
jgi:hypothetical protein